MTQCYRPIWVSKLFLYLICLVCSSLTGQRLWAQTDQRTTDITFETGEVTYWQFGLKMTANSEASKIIATVPIPISWPEQKVSLLAERKPDSLKPFSYNKLTSEVQQLVIRGNRLNAGETAEASVILKVEKKTVVGPVDVSKLRFAKKIPSKLRNYTRPSPYIESNHRRIKEIANELKKHESLAPFEQVEKIYQWVREKIEYDERDEMKTCLESLDSGKGDCFEMSSLFIAICRARKIPARAVWIPGHMYPEFYLENEKGVGVWIPCQVAGSYSFGTMEEARPIVQKGGQVQTAKGKKGGSFCHAAASGGHRCGGVSIQFINRQLTYEEAAALQK